MSSKQFRRDLAELHRKERSRRLFPLGQPDLMLQQSERWREGSARLQRSAGTQDEWLIAFAVLELSRIMKVIATVGLMRGPES